MRVLGIDPSLTSTGIGADALPDGAPLTQAEVTTRKYPRLPAGGGMGL